MPWSLLSLCWECVSLTRPNSSGQQEQYALRTTTEVVKVLGRPTSYELPKLWENQT